MGGVRRTTTATTTTSSKFIGTIFCWSLVCLLTMYVCVCVCGYSIDVGVGVVRFNWRLATSKTIEATNILHRSIFLPGRQTGQRQWLLMALVRALHALILDECVSTRDICSSMKAPQRKRNNTIKRHHHKLMLFYSVIHNLCIHDMITYIHVRIRSVRVFIVCPIHIY